MTTRSQVWEEWEDGKVIDWVDQIHRQAEIIAEANEEDRDWSKCGLRPMVFNDDEQVKIEKASIRIARGNFCRCVRGSEILIYIHHQVGL